MSTHSVDTLLETANALVTEPMTDAEAAFACAAWHGGQWTDMYGYQSSGELSNPAGIATEAESAYHDALWSEDSTPECEYELLALYQWACARADEQATPECEIVLAYLPANLAWAFTFGRVDQPYHARDLLRMGDGPMFFECASTARAAADACGLAAQPNGRFVAVQS